MRDQFSQVTSNIVEAVVSIGRLSSFLKAEELQRDARKIIEKPDLQLGDEVRAFLNDEPFPAEARVFGVGSCYQER